MEKTGLTGIEQLHREGATSKRTKELIAIYLHQRPVRIFIRREYRFKYNFTRVLFLQSPQNVRAPHRSDANKVDKSIEKRLMFHVRTLPSPRMRSKYRIPGAAPHPTPNESRWGKGLVIRPELRAVLCPEMPLTSPAPTILARLAVKAVLLLCEFYSLLNKASHERERADAKGEADEGGCEREARVGCVCGGCHAQVSERRLRCLGEMLSTTCA